MKSIDEQLRDAASGGDERKLKALLLCSDCTPMSIGHFGLTSLMLAAFYGHDACVKLLLPVSDAKIKDNNGKTALMYASSRGETACVRILLPLSDVMCKSGDDMTALILAARQGSRSCVEALLPLSDALTCDNEVKTASMEARVNGHFKLANFMDAYAVTLHETAELESSTNPGFFRKFASRRV